MGLLPMMEKGARIACHADWPLFYMNDFSRLGVVVGQLGQAVSVLQQGGFRLLDTVQGVSVVTGNSEQVSQVLQALASHQIEFELADLVSCAYQG